MLNKVSFCLAFVCFILFAESPKVRGFAPARIQMNPAHADGDQIKRLAVYLKHENAISGRFVAIEGDTLILLISGAYRKIPKDSILSVLQLNPDPPVGRYTLYGAVFAMHIGNCLFFNSEGQPTRFMDDFRSKDEMTWANALFALVGSGFGLYAIRSYSKPREIDFGFDDEAKKQEAWNKLKRDLLGLPARKFVHLSIQAGHVYSRTTDHFAKTLAKSGFQVSDFGSSQFNLIRRIQLTYSLSQSYEIGLAAYFLGEPGIYFRSDGGQTWASHTVEARGFYLLGAYRPRPFGSQNRHVLKIGLGIGVAKREYGLVGRACDQRECTTIADELSNSGASATLFTEFDLMLTNSISINLSGDYAWLPGRHIPANQALGLPKFELKSGNGSLGIGLGMHF